MRIYVAITDEQSGRARLGTVYYPGFTLRHQEEAQRTAGWKSQPHHPEDAGFNPEGKAILLTIKAGSHRIVVANDGQQEQSITLKAGEKILFLDFKAEARPAGGKFDYSGHWSEPGPEGATLSPAIVSSPVHLDRLDFQPLD